MCKGGNSSLKKGKFSFFSSFLKFVTIIITELFEVNFSKKNPSVSLPQLIIVSKEIRIKDNKVSVLIIFWNVSLRLKRVKYFTNYTSF